MTGAFLLCAIFEARAFGEESALGCIPEGCRPFGPRVEAAAGAFAPGLPGFCPGSDPPSGRVKGSAQGVIKYHCVGEVRRLAAPV